MRHFLGWVLCKLSVDKKNGQKKRKFREFFKVKFKFKDGFRTVCKLFWDHLGAFEKFFENSQVKYYCSSLLEPWRMPLSGAFLHQMAPVRYRRQKLSIIAKFVNFSKWNSSSRMGSGLSARYFDFRNLKNFLKSPQIMPKQLAGSPELVLELEFQFEKIREICVFDNICLRQRTGAIWCKNAPLKGILQGLKNKILTWEFSKHS